MYPLAHNRYSEVGFCKCQFDSVQKQQHPSTFWVLYIYSLVCRYPESMKSNRIHLDHSCIRYIRILIQCLIHLVLYHLSTGGFHYVQMQLAFFYKAAHQKYQVPGFYEISIEFNLISLIISSKTLFRCILVTRIEYLPVTYIMKTNILKWL